VSLDEVLRAWTLVYLGSFVGAIATAVMVFLSGNYQHGGGAFGDAALAAANAKTALPFFSVHHPLSCRKRSSRLKFLALTSESGHGPRVRF
jgi:hypothetical protein